MTYDPKVPEFLQQLRAYGFQVHENFHEESLWFDADVITPVQYGESPLLSIREDGMTHVLFWYNYPKEPLIDKTNEITHRYVYTGNLKPVLRQMEAHAVKHGLQTGDTARLLNYHVYGGKQSEIQTGYPAYTPAQLIQLAAMRHIPAVAMNALLAEHLPFEHIQTYDPEISPEIYLQLYPAPVFTE